ncbi:MAG: DinB family protein [Bacteroidia bacterium]
MKSINKNELISELTEICLSCKEKAIIWKSIPKIKLTASPQEGKWSADQCIEHLNRYFDYYLPEIEKTISSTVETDNKADFRPGKLGDYFAKSMKISGVKVNKMKTFKSKNPAIDLKVRENNLELFIQNIDEIINYLSKSRDKNLERLRTPVSISVLIKLKLGDTFRFVVYHIERHIIQAEKALEKII